MRIRDFATPLTSRLIGRQARAVTSRSASSAGTGLVGRLAATWSRPMQGVYGILEGRHSQFAQTKWNRKRFVGRGDRAAVARRQIRDICRHFDADSCRLSADQPIDFPGLSAAGRCFGRKQRQSDGRFFDFCPGCREADGSDGSATRPATAACRWDGTWETSAGGQRKITINDYDHMSLEPKCSRAGCEFLRANKGSYDQAPTDLK